MAAPGFHGFSFVLNAVSLMGTRQLSLVRPGWQCACDATCLHSTSDGASDKSFGSADENVLWRDVFVQSSGAESHPLDILGFGHLVNERIFLRIALHRVFLGASKNVNFAAYH